MAPFLILSLLPFLISPSLSSFPSCLLKVIGVGVIVGGPKNNFNRTLAIYSPFQTFPVGLLIYGLALPLLSPEKHSL